MQLKSFILQVAGSVKALDFLQRFDTGRLLYVLAYHRVDTAEHRPWLDPGQISATPSQFEAQMRLIASKYHPVTMEAVLEARAGGKPLPRWPVLVTFDDGYRDFADFAWPITQKHGIFPVLFVPTAYPGGGAFWWDRLYWIIMNTNRLNVHREAGLFSINTIPERIITYTKLAEYYKQLPASQIEVEIAVLREQLGLSEENHPPGVLNWQELRSLDRAGVCIAPHTHTHAILGRLNKDEASQEIRESIATLQKEIGHCPPVLAYPNGTVASYDLAAKDLLQQAGIQMAFTMADFAVNIPKCDPLEMPRLGVWPRLSASLPYFHYHLTPFYQAAYIQTNRIR